MEKWVYSFGGGKADGGAVDRDLLGGKGANLAEMSSLGLPVPPGFTLTTEVCNAYYADSKAYPDGLRGQVEAALAKIEALLGEQFGDPHNPLLVSVRSGAPVSMPGMMDTVLNLGLNDDTVQGLVRASGDARFAWDSYRRFIQMFGDVVLGVDHHHFEELLELHKEERGYTFDTEMKAHDWQHLVGAYKAKVEEEMGQPFPQDPIEQLWASIGAVFGSWMNQRAITYRALHDIPEDWGTAVNVQAMVFGNMGDDCATGVAFTRDPSTGENAFYGEYLVNAQGEDVVAGIRTPQHLTLRGKEINGSKLPAMEEVMPEVFGELCQVRDRLENHYRDMQDIEFTVQRGTLYVLQTRTGKRTTPAAIRIAVELADAGVISRGQAVARVDPISLDQLLHPTLDPKAPRDVIARALPASPGAASGRIYFTADDAVKAAEKGEGVILVRVETSPDDIHGMHAAKAILTARGGMTSHAAVVARGMGRPCVAGAGELRISAKDKTMSVRNMVLTEGEVITLDGGTGEVMRGEVPTVQPKLSGDFAKLMEWADAVRTMGVRTNAETREDVQVANEFGAEGIGLCRTEHMFFQSGRIVAMREMIMAEDENGRRRALDKLLPMQRNDFEEIFTLMRGKPVTIRLLDPPLHEFLPKTDVEITEVALAAGVGIEAVKARASRLKELNPMLGNRGCRLGISHPEIYEMQARAIFEAAARVQAKSGELVVVEVMVPLVATRKEIEIVRELIDRVAKAVRTHSGGSFDYMVGTMIELPRAALRAGEIAEHAEFFSFGTNDLTQSTFGLSRDDAASFLPTYERVGVFEHDPFVTLDVKGVGELLSMAVARGRTAQWDMKMGICGEHGGDPASIAFCQQLGLDYVSCSPYRVPIARLAAAQAAIAESAEEDVAAA